MPKISIILPVYNKEKYLRKCLDNICNQTLSDIEIICINDCSGDNSLQILKEYAAKDNRIKIVDFKEKKGEVAIKDAGIKEAKGEYIAFIKAEDFTDFDFYKILYGKVKDNKADIHNNSYNLHEAKMTIMALEKSNKNLALKLKNANINVLNKEDIYLISVVNNYDLYNKCIKDNPLIKLSQNIKLIDYNNTEDNVYITKRYNDFLNNHDYSKQGWFVFCHCDWELWDDIEFVLPQLDKTNLYGVIGAKAEVFNGKCYRTITGGCYEKRRDGSDLRCLTSYSDKIELSDTFDCQVIIMHSSLVEKYKLRFDENLKWHLYAEDFCINCKMKYGIKSYTIPLLCCHWSGFQENIPKEYNDSLEYVNSKYPKNIFGGTVSVIGGNDGKKLPLASDRDKVLLKIRQKANMTANKI